MQITYCLPSFESLKLLKNVGAKMDQNGRQSNCAPFNQIICYIEAIESKIIYTVFNRKKDCVGKD